MNRGVVGEELLDGFDHGAERRRAGGVVEVDEARAAAVEQRAIEVEADDGGSPGLRERRNLREHPIGSYADRAAIRTSTAGGRQLERFAQ